MSLRFTVLGSGTALPSVDRGPAGFLVSWKQQHWLVDGGSGTLQRCARAGVSPLLLSGGVLSHHHPDHCADLVPLLFAFRVAGREHPYPLHAGPGIDVLLERLRTAWGKWLDFPGGLDLRLRSGATRGPTELAPGLTLTSLPANHSAGALHLRFDAGGHSVVFSGDTGPSPALIELCDGADLLVTECAFAGPREHATHLWPEAVVDIVRASGVPEVWLTHLYPEVDPTHALSTVQACGVGARLAGDGDVFAPGER